MIQNYVEETAEIRCRIEREVAQLRAGVPGITRNDKEGNKMSANEIFNAIFHTMLVYDFIATMNLWLSQHNHQPRSYHSSRSLYVSSFGFVTMGKDQA
jgi:hypothetical protein